jgi:hypothetical protein
MGMDVYGIKPMDATGEYFRATVSGWHPLAHYVRQIAPEITAACKHWDSNDGDGLDAEASVALANKLQVEIDSGRTLSYKKRRADYLARLPKEKCCVCDGTGKRKPPPEGGTGEEHCNVCDGEGLREDWRTKCSFSVNVVRAFAAFLKTSGGFVIW